MAQTSGAGAGRVADLADQAGEHPLGAGHRGDLGERAGVGGRDVEKAGEAGAFGPAPAGTDAARVVQLPAELLTDQDGSGQSGQPAAPGDPPADHDVGGPHETDLDPCLRPHPRLCAAIVDRLTFNGTIIETGTDSYRLASTRARAEQTTAG